MYFCKNKDNILILYKDSEGSVSVNVRFADEDVWLTQEQLAQIYNTIQQNISQYIQDIIDDGELEETATVKEFLTVRQKEAIEKAEHEFRVYREREMRQLESDEVRIGKRAMGAL